MQVELSPKNIKALKKIKAQRERNLGFPLHITHLVNLILEEWIDGQKKP